MRPRRSPPRAWESTVLFSSAVRENSAATNTAVPSVRAKKPMRLKTVVTMFIRRAAPESHLERVRRDPPRCPCPRWRRHSAGGGAAGAAAETAGVRRVCAGVPWAPVPRFPMEGRRRHRATAPGGPWGGAPSAGVLRGGGGRACGPRRGAEFTGSRRPRQGSTRGARPGRPASPAGREGAPLREARRRLDAEYGVVPQLVQRAGAGVGAGAAHAGADVVDDVLDAGALGVQAHPRGGDALFELRLQRAVERVTAAGAGLHCTLGR